MRRRTLYGWAVLGLTTYLVITAGAVLGGLALIFSSLDGQGFRGYGAFLGVGAVWLLVPLSSAVLSGIWVRSTSARKVGFAVGLLIGLAITALLLVDRFLLG